MSQFCISHAATERIEFKSYNNSSLPLLCILTSPSPCLWTPPHPLLILKPIISWNLSTDQNLGNIHFGISSGGE